MGLLACLQTVSFLHNFEQHTRNPIQPGCEKLIDIIIHVHVVITNGLNVYSNMYINVLIHNSFCAVIFILFLFLIIRWQILASDMGKESLEKLEW